MHPNFLLKEIQYSSSFFAKNNNNNNNKEFPLFFKDVYACDLESAQNELPTTASDTTTTATTTTATKL